MYCQSMDSQRLTSSGFFHMSTCGNNYYYNVIDGQLILPVSSSASLQSPPLPVQLPCVLVYCH